MPGGPVTSGGRHRPRHRLLTDRQVDQGGACGVPGLVAIAQTTNASVANVTGVQGGQMESGLAAALL